MPHPLRRLPPKRLTSCRREDEKFAFLLDNPPVVMRMRAILGSAIQLHSATARYVDPGCPDQDWHRVRLPLPYLELGPVPTL